MSDTTLLVDEFELICAACGKPIEGDDLDDRHWGHERSCPNHPSNQVEDEDGELVSIDAGGQLVDMVDCDCDLEYHAVCCPDCNEEKDHE